MTEAEREDLAQWEREMLAHAREIMAEYRRLADVELMLWLRDLQELDWDERDYYADVSDAFAAISQFRPLMWWS